MGAAVRVAQTLLRAVDPKLELDGFWGPRTDAAYSAAPESLKASVRSHFAADRKVMPTTGRWIPASEANSMVESAAQRLALSEYANAFKTFLQREARRKTIDGVDSYDVNSRNGRSTGLMQMQPGAWFDAKKRVDPSLPDFAEGVYDPATNIRAGIAYAKLNIPSIQKSGWPVNGDTLYLAHNQGAGYFRGNHVTAFDGQSREVQNLIRRYMAGRVPVFHGAHQNW